MPKNMTGGEALTAGKILCKLNQVRGNERACLQGPAQFLARYSFGQVDRFADMKQHRSA